jgi:FMN phosphatase YigB (HAD superfamily)
VRSYKPATGHWTATRSRLGPDARWLHAAQSYFHDIAPARALGLPTAWVNRKRESAPDGGSATIEVTTLAELADALGA